MPRTYDPRERFNCCPDCHAEEDFSGDIECPDQHTVGCFEHEFFEISTHGLLTVDDFMEELNS